MEFKFGGRVCFFFFKSLWIRDVLQSSSPSFQIIHRNKNIWVVSVAKWRAVLIIGSIYFIVILAKLSK